MIILFERKVKEGFQWVETESTLPVKKGWKCYLMPRWLRAAA